VTANSAIVAKECVTVPVARPDNGTGLSHPKTRLAPDFPTACSKDICLRAGGAGRRGVLLGPISSQNNDGAPQERRELSGVFTMRHGNASRGRAILLPLWSKPYQRCARNACVAKAGAG
jgi:hypothetical protein